MHGKTSVITTTQEGVFAGLPEKFTVNRYHSLAIERASCPQELAVTAWTDDGESWACATPACRMRCAWRACSSTRKASSPSMATPC